MKTKNVTELYAEIINILESYKGSFFGSKVITGVDLFSLSQLFIEMQADGNDVRLYDANEISNCLVVVYRPSPGISIFIKSVEAEKLIPKLNTINYN